LLYLEHQRKGLQRYSFKLKKHTEESPLNDPVLSFTLIPDLLPENPSRLEMKFKSQDGRKGNKMHQKSYSQKKDGFKSIDLHVIHALVNKREDVSRDSK